jgi:lipopolysaccharide export system permease protein
VKLLDRLVILAYVRSYINCLVSLLSLYVIIDLFTNLEKFFRHDESFWRGLENVGTFYLYRSAQMFDRLCEPIVLLAGMFTVAWMQRNNELLPLLSAGVPTRRIMRPILIGALLMLGIGFANQELVIPRVADQLARDPDDFDGRKDMLIQASYDSTGIHIEGERARRAGMIVEQLHCTIPDKEGNGVVHLTAREAHYVPPGAGPYSGGWLLTDTTPATIAEWNNTKLAVMIDPGRWFLYTRTVDFDSVTRNGTWYMLFSTSRLNELLHTSDSRRLEAMAVLFHMRLTRPIIGMLLVLMGLGITLRDPNRHVFVSSGLCLAVAAAFFMVVYTCKFLGDHDLLAPALAAWLPVLLFGPIAFVMFDSMHT